MSGQGDFARALFGEAVKATPPVAVAGTTIFGLGPHDIVQLIVLGLTGVYIIYQIAFLRWKWRRAKSLPASSDDSE